MKLRILFTLALALTTVVLALAAWLIPSPTLSMLPTTLALLSATGTMIVGFLAAVEIVTTLLDRLTPKDTPPTPAPTTHRYPDAPTTPRRAACSHCATTPS